MTETRVDRVSVFEALAGMGVRVHCLALGGVDLTSSAGKLQMQVLAAVAEFELDLLKERTSAGLARAKAEGKAIGRAPGACASAAEEVKRRVLQGSPVAALARDFNVGRATVQRLRDDASVI